MEPTSMNERIQELALQAADEIADLFSPGFFDDRMVNDVAEINKKFAELIVREAIEACEKNSMLDLDAWQRSEQIQKTFRS